MRSPIYWALLGLVIERPSYGYELGQRFDRAYGDMLPISGMSHIYAALQALKSRTLIEELRAPAPGEVGKHPTPHYRATPRGVHAYCERLITQRCEDDRRSQLFARQLAVLSCDPEAALKVLEGYEREYLKEATATHGEDAATTTRRGPTPGKNASSCDVDDDAGGLVSRLTREDRRLAGQGRLTWIDYARSQFSALRQER